MFKKQFPKHVLNVAYASYIWPNKVEEWKQNGKVSSSVVVKGFALLYSRPQTHCAVSLSLEECKIWTLGDRESSALMGSKIYFGLHSDNIIENGRAKVLQKLYSKLSYNFQSLTKTKR